MQMVQNGGAETPRHAHRAIQIVGGGANTRAGGGVEGKVVPVRAHVDRFGGDRLKLKTYS